MKFDFDKVVDRHGTKCLKYDFAKERGRSDDMLPLWVADMDFPTAPGIQKSLSDAVAHGIYGYSEGKDDYFQAAAGWYEKHFGWKVEKEWLIKTPGVVFALAMAVKAYTKEGDAVLLQQPVYYPFSEVIADNGRRIVDNTLELKEDGKYHINFEDFEQKVKENHVKLFLLCSPHNPVGRVWTKEELKKIAAICRKYDVIVVSDEIHEDFVFNGKHQVFADLSEDAKNRTILVNGVSKSYAMTGWRIGYSASNPALAKVMANYLSHSTSAPSTISQHAAITALTGPQEDMQVMKEAFEKRRDHLVERMNRIEGVSCIKPEGAFYVMMNMTGFIGKTMYGKKIENDGDFAALFLEKALVATVPCTSFAAPNYLRWSYATSMENIDKGLDRLEKFIAEA